MATLVEKLSNCCDYILRLSGFPDLSGEAFLIAFKFPQLDYSAMFRKSNVNKTSQYFVVFLKYREIITVNAAVTL